MRAGYDGLTVNCAQDRTAAGARQVATACEPCCRGIRVDDWVFGVSSVAADGSESPVASAVPGGAFRPYAPPPPAHVIVIASERAIQRTSVGGLFVMVLAMTD